MKRRHFIAPSTLAGFADARGSPLATGPVNAATASALLPPLPRADDGASQAFHRDCVSFRAGLEYYVFGNGRIQVVLQTTATSAARTHAGLFVMLPEHFRRKASSFLYHPERGVENTRFFVTVDGRDYTPIFATSRVAWISIPAPRRQE